MDPQADNKEYAARRKSDVPDRCLRRQHYGKGEQDAEGSGSKVVVRNVEDARMDGEGNRKGHRVLRAPYPSLGLTSVIPDHGQGPRGESPSPAIHTQEEAHLSLDRGGLPSDCKSVSLMQLLPQSEGSPDSSADRWLSRGAHSVRKQTLLGRRLRATH